jgi:hypothetical protein
MTRFAWLRIVAKRTLSPHSMSIQYARGWPLPFAQLKSYNTGRA